MNGKRFTLRRGSILVAVAVVAAAAAVPVTRQIRAWRDRVVMQDASRSLRSMVLRNNVEGAVADWSRLPPRVAETPEVKAWYLCALARVGYSEVEKATRLARELTVKQPSNPWSWFALGTMMYAPEVGEASRKALAMMPGDPDFLWMRADAMFQAAMSAAPDLPWGPAEIREFEKVIEFVDARRGKLANPAALLVVKAQVQEFLGTQPGHDPKRVAAAIATLEEARRIDPGNFLAHSVAGDFLLSNGDPEAALPLLEQAIRLAPDSNRAHLGYWKGYSRLDPTLQASHRPAIEKDVDEVVARNPDAPLVLTRGANAYFDLGRPEKGRELEERTLRKFPDSFWEDTVASNRVMRVIRVSGLWDPGRDGPSPEGPGGQLEVEEVPRSGAGLDQEMTGGLQEFFWSYIEGPRAKSEHVLGLLYLAQFEIARRDPAYDQKQLERIAQGLADYRDYDPGGVLELANRGIALDRAEEIARVSLGRAEKQLEKRRSDPSRPYLEGWKGRVAELHDALGWVLLKRGRVDQAEKELKLAHRLDPGRRNYLYHRAALATARGDPARTEDLLAECALIAPQRDNPCGPALRDLYRKRHPDLAGYDQYGMQVLDKGRALRRERLLATRLPGETIRPFRFKSLDGTTLSSEDLKGRVAVIDFWGLWCPACVAAMPELQRLAEKYRDDPEVVIVTVDVWDLAPAVEKWVKKNGVTIPVLLEEDYVDRVGIDAYPTTWFLDREGRRIYSPSGNAGDLVEEASWLIEDLKSR